ncbi:universal stress protein [Alicyclobacillus suci]|uniref:universal stress protein n=1 Tax=Alicyclobacillus suci TaxID=2816080 RepID=UPI001A8D9AE0|nr:universal stress protein [Alicyclobacillus suci]
MNGENGQASKIPKKTGKLRLFIGAAPGVGKTYTMLREANALRERGVDIVIGYIEFHGRPDTAAQINGLEIIPCLEIEFQGRVFQEINVEAVIARKPDVVVVDELAHTNVPGSMHSKRYLDVEHILDHGIDVLTAVNVQHIEGTHEDAEELTRVKVREIIPRSFVKRASEIEVIDVTPETLRQRLRDGSIYPADKVNQALNNFFRLTNLSGLRELALREVADDVDERLQQSYDRSKIPGPVGAKETILVCVNYLERSNKLIEKGSRMAARMKSELMVLTIIDGHENDLSEKDKTWLDALRSISQKYEARHIVEPRNDRKIGEVIMDVAQRLNITQVVIGQPKASQKWAFWRDNPVKYLLQNIKYVDLRIVGWKE